MIRAAHLRIIYILAHLFHMKIIYIRTQGWGISKVSCALLQIGPLGHIPHLLLSVVFCYSLFAKKTSFVKYQILPNLYGRDE